jgi:hypothetical protein
MDREDARDDNDSFECAFRVYLIYFTLYCTFIHRTSWHHCTPNVVYVY